MLALLTVTEVESRVSTTIVYTTNGSELSLSSHHFHLSETDRVLARSLHLDQVVTETRVITIPVTQIVTPTSTTSRTTTTTLSSR